MRYTDWALGQRPSTSGRCAPLQTCAGSSRISGGFWPQQGCLRSPKNSALQGCHWRGAFEHVGKLHVVRFIFPTKRQFDEACAKAADDKIVAICITTPLGVSPHWFRYDQPWESTNDKGQVIRSLTDHCSPEDATARCNAPSGRQPQHHPPCVILSEYIFGPDSFGYMSCSRVRWPSRKI